MKQKGLSLVEVLLATSITGVIGVLLLVIIVNSAGLFYKESSTLSQGLNINDALLKVRNSIKESNGVVASYTVGSITYTTGATQIVLKIPSIDGSGNIITNVFDYGVFYLDQTKLRFKLFPDAGSSKKSQDQIFSTLVDSLTFKYLNSLNPPTEVAPTSASKIRIILTLKQKSGAGYEINTATSEANLRND